MFLKVLVLAVIAVTSQARHTKEFLMREVDDVHALGFGYQCDAGIPTAEGCAVKEPNGKYLLIAPLESGKKFEKFDDIHATGLWTSGCEYGIPAVEGCVLQDSNGKFIVIGPLINLDTNQQQYNLQIIV